MPLGWGVVRSGRDLFAWVARQRLTVAGPTVEEHLTDADGATATVLELPVA
ncbi:hypothetical protein GCM10007977_095550 [Dactylosporangium sucinum]|uniref:Uncharacterized protein n=1 Tax=Dactylosporangium sucinum TaxID=1424081 RepID=A0A917UDP5_9ACTN|nr:hypothetical protein GCM10007977_095550 [Dactylosporangium sucinum]